MSESISGGSRIAGRGIERGGLLDGLRAAWDVEEGGKSEGRIDGKYRWKKIVCSTPVVQLAYRMVGSQVDVVVAGYIDGACAYL